MFTALIVLGVLVLGIAVYHPKILGRFWRAGMAQVNEASEAVSELDLKAEAKLAISKAGESLERRTTAVGNAKVPYDKASREVSDLESKIADANALLTQIAASCDELETKGQTDSDEFRQNSALGAAKATELRQLQDDLATAKGVASSCKASYERALNELKDAKKNLQDQRKQYERIASQLDLSEIEKQMSAATASLGASDDGSVTNALGKMQDRTLKNRAQVDVRTEVSRDPNAEAEAKFRTKMNEAAGVASFDAFRKARKEGSETKAL